MNIRTLLKYWIGNREAILQIAKQPHALWIGLIFVFSAGFAREYDAEDLLHEPWFLFIPLVASIGSSLLLYFVIRFFPSYSKKDDPVNRLRYSSFLALYWMTAPLAWLYAFPVERFFTEGDAVRYNLNLLGIVSIWRVLLITRVISVLCRSSLFAAFCIVMLFADSLALGLIYYTPLPVFNIMGGIHLTDGENLVLSSGLMIGFLGVVTFPIWLITSICFWPPAKENLDQLNTVSQLEEASSTRPIAGSLWLFAFASLAIWCFILPLTQPEQQNRRQVEQLLRAEKLQEAVATMSSLKENDFPPHWDPPPHIGYGERSPSLADVLDATITGKSAPWVQELILKKIMFHFHRYEYEMHRFRSLEYGIDEMSAAQLQRLIDLLESRPEIGPKLAASLMPEIDNILENELEEKEQTGSEKSRSDMKTAWREAIERLVKLAEQHNSKNASSEENNSEELPITEEADQ